LKQAVAFFPTLENLMFKLELIHRVDWLNSNWKFAYCPRGKSKLLLEKHL